MVTVFETYYHDTSFSLPSFIMTIFLKLALEREEAIYDPSPEEIRVYQRLDKMGLRTS